MDGLPASAITPLPSVPEGWHVLRHKVIAGGRLAIVGADVDLFDALLSDREGRTRGESIRRAARARAKVWVVEGRALIDLVAFPLRDCFPIIEQFSDGRWLVANSRSQSDGNARILDAEGAELRRIELGDGIEHIKIDSRDRIWVGWFDEGVFGNDTWQYPGREWPPSVHGVAAFSEQGVMLAHATLESVADCYALNVVGDQAWACTYVDFPITRLGGVTEANWNTDLRGTRATAISEPHVLAAGGYGEDSNQVTLLDLSDGVAKTLGRWRLPFGVGYPDTIEMIDARGDTLHAVANGRWHRWTVGQFTSQRTI